MESVEEYAGSLPRHLQTKDPHPPTEATVSTCLPVGDPSSATPEANPLTIV